MGSCKRIVIGGGGIAGLEVATLLGRSLGRPEAAEIVLIDRDTAHVWKPMLHTIAAGTSDLHREQVPFAPHALRHGFSYWPGEVESISRVDRVLRLAPLRRPDGSILLDAREISYDILILSAGSRANDFGTPGVAQHCRFIDSRLQAEAFNQEARAQILKCIVESTGMRSRSWAAARRAWSLRRNWSS